MRCVSRFKRFKPSPVTIEELAYQVMEQIRQATNARVLRVADNDEWVEVEYDWPDDGPYFDATDVLVPRGLELKKGWQNCHQERLR